MSKYNIQTYIPNYISSYIQSLKNINSNNIREILDPLNDKVLIQLREILDQNYYSGEKQLLADYQYDLFYDYLIERVPSEKDKIGDDVIPSQEKVKLPYWVGSLDKIKEKKQIDRWVEKYKSPYVISEKLDGISIVIEIKNKTYKLYTRGDGEYGSDVSYLQNIIKLPNIREYDKITIRGELVMKNSIFRQKYQDLFNNPRQMVCGMAKSKTIKSELKDVDFIAHEILGSNDKISTQFSKLEKMGFNIPNWKSIKNISFEILEKELKEMKASSPYNIDGIVVRSDHPYKLNTSGNPDYSFAFKIMGEIFETRVQEVLWNLSKRGYLKPIVKIDPVNTGEVVITYVSGANAKNIVNLGIGEGAIIQITRSGDVIPHIVGVIKKTKPSLPNRKYIWNDTEVDIIAQDIDEDEMKIKCLYELVSGLGFLNLGESTVKKMYEYAGITSFKKILNIKPNTLENIKGMGKASSERIYNSVQEGIKNMTIPKFLGVSGALGHGIGEKKVQLLIDRYPKIFIEEKNHSVHKYMEMINDVKGFSTISSKKIAPLIESAKKLIKKYEKYFNIYENKIEENKEENYKLQNYVFVFSGFRDKNLSSKLQDNGAKVDDNITKKTTHLVVKDINSSTGKIEKAKKMGIKIIGVGDLEKLIKF